MKKLLLGILLTFALASGPINHARAAEGTATPGAADATPSPDKAADTQIAAIKKIFSELRPQHGEVDINSGLAKLSIPDGFQYLNEKDARSILVDVWHNPPQSAEGVIGMIVQSPESLLTEDGWGVIVTYTEDGHIDDADAHKINYNEILKQMQEGTAEANKERQKNGYSTVQLVGWAEPPHYDPATHKIYWAKELAFGDTKAHTLNYCIRILGRRGVMELNTVAPISALPAIRSGSEKILGMVDFKDGHRYADYDQKTDKLATYGLAALVAGGIAGKMGLFKVILVGLLAAKKFVIVGVVAAASVIRKFFAGRSAKKPGEE